MDGYPSPIAARLTGVSVQTLQMWSHRGFIKPSIPGCAPRPGVYTFRDLVAIRVADDLRARGIEIHCLKRVVAYLRKRKGLALTASDVLASTLLVTDGHDVYEVDGQVGVSTLRNPDQSVMLVPFGRVVAKLQEEALKLSASVA
jgi:DNA-binding transcriptional MerR regulator